MVPPKDSTISPPSLYVLLTAPPALRSQLAKKVQEGQVNAYTSAAVACEAWAVAAASSAYSTSQRLAAEGALQARLPHAII